LLIILTGATGLCTGYAVKQHLSAGRRLILQITKICHSFMYYSQLHCESVRTNCYRTILISLATSKPKLQPSNRVNQDLA